MDILISAEGDHEPKGHHYMVVDGEGALIDLSGVDGTLHDPAILRVTWGTIGVGGAAMPGGVITRRGGTTQNFFDAKLLEPYLAAFKARRQALAAEQAKFDQMAKNQSPATA